MKSQSWCERFLLLTVIYCGLGNSALAEANVTVEVNKPGHKVSPTLWGVFFEDINHSADGGIYPELVRNRSFEDSDKPDFWTLTSSGDMSIDSARPMNLMNPRSLMVRLQGGS